MSPWIKAGLIGAAAIIVLDLLGLIPCVAVFSCVLGLVVYLGTGALAAFWMPPVRESGPAAGQGAMAAVLAALLGGILNTILIALQMAATDTATVLSQIPPESLQQLQELGMDPGIFVSPVFGGLVGSLCCLTGAILAAILGAVGGAIFAAIKAE